MTSGVAGTALVGMLEKQLNDLQLDKNWNGANAKFIVHVGHIITDHQNVVNLAHCNNTFYITKFNVTLSLHPEMLAYPEDPRENYSVLPCHRAHPIPQALSYSFPCRQRPTP
jgi:hypothetical protein